MTTYKDFPQRITDPVNQEPGVMVMQTPGQSKFTAFGSLFLQCDQEGYNEKIAWVKIPHRSQNKVYLINIALTMLTAPGGDFDEDDTVYADIFSIGYDPNTGGDVKPDALLPRLDKPSETFGGVWGHHFGKLGMAKSMGISTYIGPIRGDIVKLRLACRGAQVSDNWVGASYFILELGILSE